MPAVLAAHALRRARRLCAGQRGSVTLIFFVYMPLAAMCLAFAVDYALVHIERRGAQGVVDIAAIIAAEHLSEHEDAARNILELNGFDTINAIELGRIEDAEEYEEAVNTRSQVGVVAGHYEADADTPPADRFTPGGAPLNAARVTVSKKSRLYFARNIFDSPEINVTATARRRELAAFSVGSRLASVEDGLLNVLLGELTGASISLSVLDYEALLDAEVDVFEFLDALAAGMNITAGDYDNVLDSDPTLQDVIDAMVEAHGYGRAATALGAVNGAAGGFADEVDLRRVIALGEAGSIALGAADERGVPAAVSMFDLLMANTVVANGDRLLELDLIATAPGLAALTVTLDLGEQLQLSPWLSVGQRGEVVTNVQTRAFIEALVGGSEFLSGIEVRLPLYLEVARAQGELLSVDCPGGLVEEAVVNIGGASSVAEAWIGDIDMTSPRANDNPIQRARIVSAPGLVAFAHAHAAMNSGAQETLAFSWDDISDGVIKSTQSDEVLPSLLSSLLGDVDIDARVLDLGLSTGGLADAALADALETLTAPTSQVVDGLMDAFGVSVGEGDFRVNGVKCDRAVLVE